MARIGIIAVMAALLGGCGLGVLQTARPVARGVVEATAGTGVMANDVIKARNNQDYGWSFVEIGTRMGLTDNLDIGGKLQFFPGGLLDLRYNFLDKRSPLALSMRGGFGGSAGSNGMAIHVPLALGISYD